MTQPCATAHDTRADVAASGLAPAQPSMHVFVVHASAHVTLVLHPASARHADASVPHFDSAHCAGVTPPRSMAADAHVAVRKSSTDFILSVRQWNGPQTLCEMQNEFRSGAS